MVGELPSGGCQKTVVSFGPVPFALLHTRKPGGCKEVRVFGRSEASYVLDDFIAISVTGVKKTSEASSWKGRRGFLRRWVGKSLNREGGAEAPARREKPNISSEQRLGLLNLGNEVLTKSTSPDSQQSLRYGRS